MYFVGVNGNNTIFTMTGNHGDVWMKGNHSITSTTQFSIIFEAIRGRDYTGDIALDDITLNSGICSLQTTPSSITSPGPTLGKI